VEADAGDDGGEEGAGQEAGGQAVEVLRCHADKVKGCVWRERGCFAVGKGFVEYSDTFKLAVWEGVRRGVLKVTQGSACRVRRGPAAWHGASYHAAHWWAGAAGAGRHVGFG
jgi:hypothetical protein